MKNFFSALHGASLLHSAVSIQTALLFAAAGGLFTELGGVLNIALEGLLLAGAFSAVAVFFISGSLAAALLAAIISSMALAFLLAAAALKLRSNVFIAGLAVNLLASGLTVVLSHYLFNTKGVIALTQTPHLRLIQIPFINAIPIIGDLLSGHSLFVYAGWILLFAAWLALYKTPFGYRLRSCGKHAQALASLGLKPDRYRFAAFLISGFCCGIGGAYLSLGLGAFVPNMSAGKGWIALVVIFLGGRRPLGLLAAAFAFGLAEAFSNYAQGFFNIPADFILAAPYLFALIAMVAIPAYRKRS